MSTTVLGADTRYAFAPRPPTEDNPLYRVHIIFESGDGQLSSAGTDLMSMDEETATRICDGLNIRLGIDRHQSNALARKLFGDPADGGRSKT